MSERSPRFGGHLLALATVCVWGSTFISTKQLLPYFSPLQLMLLRFVVGYAVLWLLRPRRLAVDRRTEPLFFLLGFLGCTLYFWTENTALKFTLASNVSIIIAMAPILTSILAHFFTRDEKLHPAIWYGFVSAMAGVVLVVFNGAVILQLNPIGDLLSLMAALCWAVYSVILKRCSHICDSVLLARRTTFYAILTGMPLLLISGEYRIDLEPLLQPQHLLHFLFLAVVGSAFCYISWNIVVQRLGAVTANNYIYLQPFVTIMVASVVLQEPISWMAILGALLIIGGVILSGRRKKGTDLA